MDRAEYNAVLEKIRAQESRIFYVEFRRRNDKVVDGKVLEPAGTVRRMNCRLHVSKGVTGALPPGQRKTEDERSQCLTVFEMNGSHSSFKRIPIDSIVAIKLS